MKAFIKTNELTMNDFTLGSTVCLGSAKPRQGAETVPWYPGLTQKPFENLSDAHDYTPANAV